VIPFTRFKHSAFALTIFSARHTQRNSFAHCTNASTASSVNTSKAMTTASQRRPFKHL